MPKSLWFVAFAAHRTFNLVGPATHIQRNKATKPQRYIRPDHWHISFFFKIAQNRYCVYKLPCIRAQVELSNTFVYDYKMSTSGDSARNSHFAQEHKRQQYLCLQTDLYIAKQNIIPYYRKQDAVRAYTWESLYLRMWGLFWLSGTCECTSVVHW